MVKISQSFLTLKYPKQSVTLHTDKGDIKIELFIDATPKTCENFLAHCAEGYYNDVLWHRNIPGFMIQTGMLSILFLHIVLPPILPQLIQFLY